MHASIRDWSLLTAGAGTEEKLVGYTKFWVSKSWVNELGKTKFFCHFESTTLYKPVENLKQHQQSIQQTNLPDSRSFLNLSCPAGAFSLQVF